MCLRALGALGERRQAQACFCPQLFIKAISGSSMRSHPQSRCASRVPTLGTGRGTGSRGEVLGHSRQDKFLGAEKMA